MPFVERERYQIQSTCRLHPDNDLYRDQEQHKVHVDVYEWKCGYCRKSFNEEKFLDQHFATRHHILLNTTRTKILFMLSRTGLVEVVPKSHNKFLANMVGVHEEVVLLLLFIHLIRH
ncbi:uncharacterized protein LOC130501724 [Raphanus sativus]|uniref:Uncharacterized protein LOC130501724 n=1 Tax=Raphanus sativus TaxID=3726 RepID=A0A9W3CM58_RAPSA|nr:uncharacterized protein LOC130501724 [Raphanus sativus]